MQPDLHFALAGFARNDFQHLAGLVVFNPPQIGRELFIKDAMEPDDEIFRGDVKLGLGLKA